MTGQPTEEETAGRAESDPRGQVRDLIAAKLRGCPSGRFNIAAMADAVMELFPEVELIREGRYADGSWPQRAYEFPNYIDPTHTRFELRTAPERVKPVTDVAAVPRTTNPITDGPQ